MSDALVIEGNSECDDQTIKSNLIFLERQLAGFGLQIDPLKRDGDCAFRSLVREFKKLAADNLIITNHMNLLHLPQDEDSATFHLRQLLVNELQKEGTETSNFISATTEVAQKARAFRLHGAFDRDIGDLVMKVCCNILKTSIMVVTSNQSMPYFPFSPDDPVSNELIYVAYHCYGASHYDATEDYANTGRLTYFPI